MHIHPVFLKSYHVLYFYNLNVCQLNIWVCSNSYDFFRRIKIFISWLFLCFVKIHAHITLNEVKNCESTSALVSGLKMSKPVSSSLLISEHKRKSFIKKIKHGNNNMIILFEDSIYYDKMLFCDELDHTFLRKCRFDHRHLISCKWQHSAHAAKGLTC